MFVEPVIASSNVDWTTSVFHESPQDNRLVVPSTGFTFGDIVQFYRAYMPFHITCLASIWVHCVQYMGICYVIMFEGYNARTGTFLLRPLHHIWSHWIPSTHIQYISNMSQQHATTSSPILTSEDHAEGVIAHAAKVIMQYIRKMGGAMVCLDKSDKMMQTWYLIIFIYQRLSMNILVS